MFAAVYGLGWTELAKAVEMLFNHPLTDKGLDQFLKDYHKVFQEQPVG